MNFKLQLVLQIKDSVNIGTLYPSNHNTVENVDWFLGPKVFVFALKDDSPVLKVHQNFLLFEERYLSRYGSEQSIDILLLRIIGLVFKTLISCSVKDYVI